MSIAQKLAVFSQFRLANTLKVVGGLANLLPRLGLTT